MSEWLAFLGGLVAGIAIWAYCDFKDGTYDRGYRDGYLRGKHEGREE